MCVCLQRVLCKKISTLAHVVAVLDPENVLPVSPGRPFCPRYTSNMSNMLDLAKKYLGACLAHVVAVLDPENVLPVSPGRPFCPRYTSNMSNMLDLAKKYLGA